LKIACAVISFSVIIANRFKLVWLLCCRQKKDVLLQAKTLWTVHRGYSIKDALEVYKCLHCVHTTCL